MILLDTNVVSELMRPSPDPAVETWVGAQPATSLFLSAITEAELRYGVAILPGSRRRTALEAALEGMLNEDLRGRILPFDSAAAALYATIAAERRKIERPLAESDCQIAATARSRGAAIATRNVPDFEHCGVEIIDPWQAG